MSDVYENIAPTISLRNFKGNNIVQTVAFDRIPNGNILKRSNAKPGDNIYITGKLGRGRKGLDDWNNNTCEGQYLKSLHENRIKKGVKK